MPKDPSMHIRLSHFTDILASHGIDNPKKLAMRIFAQAIPYNIHNRHSVEGDAATKKKVMKLVATVSVEEMTVQRFNRLLDAERRKAGHRHISMIRKPSNEWNMLKEIANMAVDFCEGVGIDNISEGCATYLQIGLSMMNKSHQYALGKFKYYDAKIYQLYESLDLIATDPAAARTKEFSNVYANLLMEYASISRDLSKPQDYICFLLAREEADRVQADVEDWIRAQFEEINKAFGSVAEIRQLFGDWAVRRYYSYFQTPKQEQDEIIRSTPKQTGDTFAAKYAKKVAELKNQISEQ